MIQKVTVTRTNIKDGEGTKGPWRKIGIQTKEHGDKWLGTFFPGTKFPNPALTAQLEAIKEGSVIDIVVEQSGDFLNFKFASRLDKVEADVSEIKNKLGMGQVSPSASPEQPDDINPDDIPF
jgi:hypothetical protein